MNRKLLCLILTIALTCAALVSCGTQPENNGLKPVTVVLDWFANTNHTGLYAALDKGYFADEGLDVKIIEPGDSSSIDLVAAKQAEFGVGYQEGVTQARSTGTPVPVTAICAVIQHNTSALSATSDKGIKGVEDFQGKTYGGFGSPIEDAVIACLMKKYGLDPESVNSVVIGEMDFFAALKNTVDFSWIYEGWTGVEAQVRGVGLDSVFLRDEDERLDYYTPVLISHDDYLAANPDTAKAFMRAVTKGYALCASDPEAAADILLKYSPELDRELVVASQKYLADKYIDDAPRFGEMKLSVWEGFAGFLDEYGLLENEFDAEGAFTNDYLPAK